MSEIENNGQEQQGGEEEEVQVSELDLLKDRARMMGIVFSNNIGVESLKKKIQDKMDGTEEQAKPTEQAEQVNPLGETPSDKPLTKQELRRKIIDEAMKLVRVRITNMDPKKKDLAGEIITVANEYIGNVKRYVPYGEETEDGWHVPQCIFNQLEAKEYLQIRTIKDKRTGTFRTVTSFVKEFGLHVLPQLTQEELDKISAAQAAAAGG